MTVPLATVDTKEQKEILQSFESTANEKNYAKRKSFFDKIKDKFD